MTVLAADAVDRDREIRPHASASALAFINPGSGNADPEEVEQALRMRVPDIEIQHIPQGGDMMGFLRREIGRRRPDQIVASGGDGTISAVVSAMGDRLVPLTIVPSGTANLLAHELGIPLDLSLACDLLVSGRVRPIDTMLMSSVDPSTGLEQTRRCLCRVGFGQIAEVGEQTSSAAKQLAKGLAYIAQAVPRVLESCEYQFELEVDGLVSQVTASSIVVTSVGAIGLADLCWGPQVRLDDGMLDAFVIDPGSLTERLAALRSVLQSDAPAADGITHMRVHRSMAIRGAQEHPVVADGEPLLARAHHITVLPRSLPVRVPA